MALQTFVVSQLTGSDGNICTVSIEYDDTTMLATRALTHNLSNQITPTVVVRRLSDNVVVFTRTVTVKHGDEAWDLSGFALVIVLHHGSPGVRDYDISVTS